jgi:hypothetical protein
MGQSLITGPLLAMLLAGAQGGDSTTIEQPAGPLVCRHESVVSRLLIRRKLCITAAEWAERDRKTNEASRRSIYELMGNTDCLNGGICSAF